MASGDTQLDQLINDPKWPTYGAAVIQVKSGEVVAKACAGPSISIHTRFRIASISKFVAAMAFAKLAATGKLDLNQDVSDWLGFELRHPRFPNDPITLTHLLSHTSTLRDATAYSMPMPHTVDEFFRPGAVWYEDGAHFGTEDFSPGQFFTYCNLNYGIAASVLEKVTGRRFDLYMREAIFEPLGISPSYNVSLFTTEQIQTLSPLFRLRDGVWQPQVDDHKGVVPAPLSIIENPDVHEKFVERFGDIRPKSDLENYELGTNGTLFSPQGGLRISAVELLVIMRHVSAAFQAGEPWVAELIRPNWRSNDSGSNGDNFGGLMTDWGVGTHLFDRQLGWLEEPHPNFVGHLGEAYGLLSGLLFDPNSGDGLIYIIPGTSGSPEENPGRKSAFSAWEEVIIEEWLP
ncbi:MAG: serine hydrolase domain-containing protein [Chloroflexota bacterium]